MTGSFFTYNTERGKVTLAAEDGRLVRLAFGERELPGIRRPDAVMNEAATQLQEYLAGKRRLFDLPLAPQGTQFQQEVWSALQLIPYGETRTYGEVARAIGRPGASRAVGSANRANPMPILIPCHRVVPSAGGVGGYAYGEQAKRFLLALEKAKA